MVKTKLIYDGDDLILFVARMKEAIQKGYRSFKIYARNGRITVYGWRRMRGG